MLFLQDGADAATIETAETVEKTSSILDNNPFTGMSMDSFGDPEWWKELGTWVVMGAGPPILGAIAVFIIGRIVAKGWRSDAGSNRTPEVTTQVWSPCFDVACRFIIASGSLRVR